METRCTKRKGDGLTSCTLNEQYEIQGAIFIPNSLLEKEAAKCKRSCFNAVSRCGHSHETRKRDKYKYEPQSMVGTRNIKYRDNIRVNMVKILNIVDESQFLTSTSNVHCMYFRLDR